MVEHSLDAPAVGYRITARGVSIFYVPDLVRIHERHEAMSGIALYVGDGTSITRLLVRRRGDTTIGHASVHDQLNWCREEGVRRVIITHCGSRIVKGDAGSVAAKVEGSGRERGVEVVVAHDDLEIGVSSSGIRSDIEQREHDWFSRCESGPLQNSTCHALLGALLHLQLGQCHLKFHAVAPTMRTVNFALFAE
jgi:Beta-lactamase superfamily domain